MMTTVGRGRGNWGNEALPTPLRRPGEANRNTSEEEDNIIAELSHLDLNDSHKLGTVEEQIKGYCYNRERLWKITQKLYDSGMKERNMGEKVLKVWQKLSKLEVNEVKLRSVIMKTAQTDFEERETIRKDDTKRFLNAVALFGGIFHYLTLPSGEPYTVLVEPMIEYLQLLLKEFSKDLSSREAELELLTVQLNLNGKLLQKYGEESLMKLMLEIRTTLVGSLPSAKCRYLLLLILDLSTHNWSHHSFPSLLKSFYLENLGKSFSQLNNVDIKTIVASSPDNEPRKSISRNNLEDNPSSGRKQETGFSRERNVQFKESSYEKGNRRSWQDGGGEQQERRKPPYWGHDDRFDKQDDNYSGGGRGQHDFSDRGSRRGGPGGRGSWRGRGDGRSKRDGSHWQDLPQRDIPATEHIIESEERW